MYFLSIWIAIGITTTIIPFTIGSQLENKTCGVNACALNQGECIVDNTSTECICFEGFTTFPANSTLKCNYERKKQLNAFILETVLTYGIGHFYALNYHLAVPKMLFWFLSYCLFIFLRNIVRTNEDQNKSSIHITLLAILFLLLMFGWQIADMVLYATRVYTDGNGVALLPWGSLNVTNSEF